MISTEEADAGTPPADPQPEPPAPPVALTPASPKPRSRRPLEWFWRGSSLAEARAALGSVSELERERLGRARRALELADRARDPVDPLRTGSSTALSLSLYREAAYWALLAQNEAWSAANLREALALPDSELLTLAANGPEALGRVRSALVEKDFVATAEDLEEERQRDADAARELVHALVRLKLQPEAKLGSLLLQRWARTIGLGLVVVGLAIGGWLLSRELGKGPDLAAGKPWQASSVYSGCDLHQHLCGTAAVKIFFHTDEEDQPWVKFDLGRPTWFARVELVNRSDSGADRAYPVVIETSKDGTSWREVARREDSYSTWLASFKPLKARYVRARLLKRTWFHLERFSVYAP